MKNEIIESHEANWFNLMCTALPVAVFISLYYTIKARNLLCLLAPAMLYAVIVFSKPVEKCEHCSKTIKHNVEGPFDFCVCGCNKKRWRPVWYLWAEKLHKKIFGMGDKE